jgi:hypothetical protein
LDIGQQDDDDIPPPEQFPDLFDALRELPHMFDNLYLQMQCRNISITDQALNPMEEQLLFRRIDLDHTPLPEAFLLSAWSQMWVFAFFELMRTWKVLVDDNLKFARAIVRAKTRDARQAVIDKKIAENDCASRLTVDFGAYHRAAMCGVIHMPAENILSFEKALDHTKLLRRMLAEVRTSLAKHEVTGARAYAPSPGYGLISPINGSIGWRIVYQEPLSEAIISRRDIANECRAMGRNMGALPPLDANAG